MQIIDSVNDLVVESKDKAKDCIERGIQIYISHSVKDLERVDGAVKYFILVNPEKAGEQETTENGTTVYYVQDLSKESVEYAITEIESDNSSDSDGGESGE